MYVEFLGVPGAGKTTLVEEVRKLLEREGIQCVTRATFFPKKRTWKYKFLWMLLHLQYLDFSIATLLIKLSRAKGSTLKKLVIRLHEHQKLQYQIIHQDGRVVLWDAGHVQRLSNIARMHILCSVSVTELIYERIPKDALLIFVATPVKVAITRMKEREPARKVDGLQELLTQTKQAQQNIFTTLSTKGMTTVMIDGTKPVKESATIVCERIKKKL